MVAGPIGNEREATAREVIELRRSHVSQLPASGAWRPGDPPAQRQLLHFGDRSFALEGGGVLPDLTMAYETWGTLAADASNAILLCHALTGDAHAAGPLLPGQPTSGWWDHMIGPGRPIDTDRWFVVCANVLGGCQGTTGPASPHPDDGKPWGSRFPVVSVRDWVRSQEMLANHLGIECWHSVIGGSMGGMQALEWAVMFPDRVRSIVPIATAAAASAAADRVVVDGTARDPHGPGLERRRLLRRRDPAKAPTRGSRLARMISQITFRSDDVFTRRFGREAVEPLDGFSLWQRFEVERYLEYHGDKLVRRFDANSYLLLTKAMDLHDLGRGRQGVDAAMTRLRAPVLAIGVQSDILYPLHQSQAIVEHARAAGVEARSVELDSPHGHDAFLIEHDQVGIPLSAFLDDMETRHA